MLTGRTNLAIIPATVFRIKSINLNSSLILFFWRQNYWIVHSGLDFLLFSHVGSNIWIINDLKSHQRGLKQKLGGWMRIGIIYYIRLCILLTKKVNNYSPIRGHFWSFEDIQKWGHQNWSGLTLIIGFYWSFNKNWFYLIGAPYW